MNLKYFVMHIKKIFKYYNNREKNKCLKYQLNYLTELFSIVFISFITIF